MCTTRNDLVTLPGRNARVVTTGTSSPRPRTGVASLALPITRGSANAIVSFETRATSTASLSRGGGTPPCDAVARGGS